jgi:LysM repeat protein
MKWKDASDDAETQTDEEGTFEEAYSPLRSRKIEFGSRLASVFTRSGSWFVIIPVGLLILMFFFVRPGGSDKAFLSELDQRLQQLESNMGSFEGIKEAVTDLDKNRQATQPLMTRLDRLETSFANRISEMEKQIKKLQAKAAKPAVKQRQTPIAKTKPSKRTTKTHVVNKGETLYSISKQYGVTVTQLMKFNQLSKGAVINPGQKLKVSP